MLHDCLRRQTNMIDEDKIEDLHLRNFQAVVREVGENKVFNCGPSVFPAGGRLLPTALASHQMQASQLYGEVFRASLQRVEGHARLELSCRCIVGHKGGPITSAAFTQPASPKDAFDEQREPQKGH